MKTIMISLSVDDIADLENKTTNSIVSKFKARIKLPVKVLVYQKINGRYTTNPKYANNGKVVGEFVCSNISYVEPLSVWDVNNFIAYDKPIEFSKFNIKRPPTKYCLVKE